MESFISARGLPEYYRCDVANKTSEDWYLEGEKRYYHGVYCIVYGLIFQALYVPCMVVFTHKDLWTLPVYKIMLFITVCDIMNLTSNSVFGGYFLIVGAVYCNYPVFMYIWGCVLMTSWFGCCIGCFFLVLSRLIDLMSPFLHDALFAGKRIIVMFIIMFGYLGFCFMYTKPALFNSVVRTWIFDPLIYTDGRDFAQYKCILTVVNNVGTVSSTLVMYVAFFIVFAYKLKRSYNYTMDKKQKQILVQSFVVCMNNLASACIYVSYTFVNAGPVLIFAGLLTWQLSSGAGILVFYVMNKTIRKRVFNLVGLGKYVSESVVAPTNAASKSQNLSSVGKEIH